MLSFLRHSFKPTKSQREKLRQGRGSAAANSSADRSVGGTFGGVGADRQQQRGG